MLNLYIENIENLKWKMANLKLYVCVRVGFLRRKEKKSYGTVYTGIRIDLRNNIFGFNT